MENYNKPLIKLFSIDTANFMYDAVKNKIIKIESKELFVALNILAMSGSRGIENRTLPPTVRLQIKKLIRQGYLQNPIRKIEHPYTDLVEAFLNRNIETLILEVTQDCNFKCRYCGFANDNAERNHSNKNMPNDLVELAIDFYKSKSIDCPEAHISFYGGEPLMALKCIEHAIDYARKRFFVKPIKYNLTTNGSLLTRETVDFLASNNVQLMISLDGPEDVQNKNRRFISNGNPTYSIVKRNLEYISEHYPEYYNNIIFNSVLLFHSDISKAKSYYEELGIPKEHVRINMANTEHIEFFNDAITEGKPDDLNNDWEEISMDYQNAIQSKSIITKSCHHSGPCVPGSKKLFVTLDGNFFPCEKINSNNKDYNIGNIHTGFDVERVKKLLNIGYLSEQNCKNCWALNFCSICCAQCDGIIGLDTEIKQQRCDYTKKNALSFLKKQAISQYNNSGKEKQ